MFSCFSVHPAVSIHHALNDSSKLSKASVLTSLVLATLSITIGILALTHVLPGIGIFHASLVTGGGVFFLLFSGAMVCFQILKKNRTSSVTPSPNPESERTSNDQVEQTEEPEKIPASPKGPKAISTKPVDPKGQENPLKVEAEKPEKIPTKPVDPKGQENSLKVEIPIPKDFEDPKAWQCDFELNQHTHPVIQFETTEKWMIELSLDSTMNIYDRANHTCVKSIDVDYSKKFSFDSSHIYVAGGKSLLIYNIDSLELEKQIPTKSGGTLFFDTCMILKTWDHTNQRNEYSVYEIPSGNLKGNLQIPNSYEASVKLNKFQNEHPNETNAFPIDQQHLLIASKYGNESEIWHPATLKRLHSLTHSAPVQTAALFGKQLFVYTNQIEIWDVESGDNITEIGYNHEDYEDYESLIPTALFKQDDTVYLSIDITLHKTNKSDFSSAHVVVDLSRLSGFVHRYRVIHLKGRVGYYSNLNGSLVFEDLFSPNDKGPIDTIWNAKNVLKHDDTHIYILSSDNKVKAYSFSFSKNPKLQDQI